MNEIKMTYAQALETTEMLRNEVLEKGQLTIKTKMVH